MGTGYPLWSYSTITTTNASDWAYATSGSNLAILPYTLPYFPSLPAPEEERRPTVNVYMVILIDKLENEIIRHALVLGRNDAEATAALALTKAEAKAVQKGDNSLVISKLGSYTPVEVVRTKTVK